MIALGRLIKSSLIRAYFKALLTHPNVSYILLSKGYILIFIATVELGMGSDTHCTYRRTMIPKLTASVRLFTKHVKIHGMNISGQVMTQRLVRHSFSQPF